MGINKKFKRIPAPVLTRWWFVGVAACMLLEDWEVWKKFMVVTRNDPLSFGKAVNDIASSNISLMAEPMIKSDLLLISAFHTFFMFPHFKFLQGGDEQSKRCGYQTKHLLERYFLMHEDLRNNTNKQWPKNTHFDDFMEYNRLSLSPSEQIEQADKVDRFFTTCLRLLDKHFYRVANGFLVCALGGEPICSMYVARFLLGNDNGEATNVTYNSEFHNSKIKIDSFREFIKQKYKSKQEITNSAHLTQFAPEALQLISSGELIWSSETLPPTLLNFRKLFSQRYLPIPSQTQMTERGVKEGKIFAIAS